ncbi:hypothetical protein NAL32_15980 [Chryseobacterium sp. Ch-15]|uniref:Lipocalin-like domain-containing protein n=1 Tax=Chryseobacterium muglaense TaxID=2893752 RepID=A0A9Q3UX75_9FLAO|nr:hypothetical protein [Chryseobacterium muglaense]MBD3904695.1 hypothetical protein [Chryseobacterium muglaense]MCC9035591.1 hypothetical protein [Chryseobacterium muglaense]MCM2555884.1 hypothetical protein [Chryseobacterium muglaense]
MKKLFSVLFFCLLIISCQSQKITDQQNDENKAKYFSGTWTLVQKNYKEDGETKVFDLHECMKRYELIFKNSDEKSILTKTFATGKDCEIKSRSDDFLVLINGGSFSYREYDLKKVEQYKIYSQNKFSIIYGDIINGKVTEIEDFYQRKK